MTPFTWTPGSTCSLAVTTTSANVALPKVPNGVDFQVRLYNSGAVPAFVLFTSNSSATVSTATEIPLAPGSVEVLTVHATAANPISLMAGVTSANSTTVYATVGRGL